jgi:uncharacterized protein YndB with AHSA1/START domain
MPELRKVGRVSGESVLKGSGKNWDQWVAALDKAGARMWTRTEIVAHLKKKHKLTPWWQQGVAHGYLVATNRRVDGQNAKGTYQITATKSIAADGAKVWKALASKEGIALWLKPLSPVSLKAGRQFETEDGFFGEIRTIKPKQRVRLSWMDPEWEKKTVVQIGVVDRPKKNTILYFQHDGLKTARLQAELRARWKNALEALRALIGDE